MLHNEIYLMPNNLRQRIVLHILDLIIILHMYLPNLALLNGNFIAKNLSMLIPISMLLDAITVTALLYRHILHRTSPP